MNTSQAACWSPLLRHSCSALGGHQGHVALLHRVILAVHLQDAAAPNHKAQVLSGGDEGAVLSDN